MTPQERELVADLFQRLAELEREPRDPDAERTIREGLARAPNALYALVQTVLLQDEALKAADDHIQELEQELTQRGGGQGGPERQRGFLDSMRDSIFGRDEPRGSVPPTGGGRPMGVPPGYGGGGYNEPGMGGPGGGMGSGPFGMGTGPMGGGGPRGGGFLGTAAAAAAGAIGGGLLMNGIRSAMAGAGGGQGSAGGAGKGPFAGAFDQLTGGAAGAGGRGGSPWESGGQNPLAREAGLDDIGSSRRTGMADMRNQGAGQSDDDLDFEDADYEDDDSDFDDDDQIET